MRVLDFLQTVGDSALWQIIRYEYRGFCEWAFCSEIEAILCLNWTIFDKNVISLLIYRVFNVSVL